MVQDCQGQPDSCGGDRVQEGEGLLQVQSVLLAIFHDLNTNDLAIPECT